MTTQKNQLVVIGGGAAGLTAGIFASRMGLDTMLLEKLMPGGQVINSEKIEDSSNLVESIPIPKVNIIAPDNEIGETFFIEKI